LAAATSFGRATLGEESGIVTFGAAVDRHAGRLQQTTEAYDAQRKPARSSPRIETCAL
jgi:hypothetical protein